MRLLKFESFMQQQNFNFSNGQGIYHAGTTFDPKQTNSA